MNASGTASACLCNNRPADSARFCWQIGLSVIVTLAACAILASQWQVVADESHRQAIASAKVLEGVANVKERTEAIRGLVRTDEIDVSIAFPPLLRSLADPMIEVRVEAAQALGPAVSAALLTGSDDGRALTAIEALKGSLDDQDPAIRIAAIYSLGSIAASKNPSGIIHPKTLVEALACMLDDPDLTVRASTIAALGVAGPVAAPKPPSALLGAFHDESPFNRAAAVRALTRFPNGLDKPGIDALSRLLETEHDDSPVREACIEVLDHADPRGLTGNALQALRAELPKHKSEARVNRVSVRR